MSGEFDVHVFEDLDGFIGGGHAFAGGDAGAGDMGGDAVGFLLVDQILGDGLGHGAPAGVSGADEEDGAFEVGEDLAFTEHAFFADFNPAFHRELHGC